MQILLGEVVNAGNYPVVRQVMNITNYYLMVAGIYECEKCREQICGMEWGFCKAAGCVTGVPIPSHSHIQIWV